MSRHDDMEKTAPRRTLLVGNSARLATTQAVAEPRISINHTEFFRTARELAQPLHLSLPRGPRASVVSVLNSLSDAVEMRQTDRANIGLWTRTALRSCVVGTHPGAAQAADECIRRVTS